MNNIQTRHLDDYVAKVRDAESKRRAYLAAAGVRVRFANEARDGDEETHHLAQAATYERLAADVS